jgi:hypothetical protein
MMDIQPRSPPFFYAKSVDFQGFFDILSEKTSGLSNAQAAAGMVEVTGFEPATFWSRTILNPYGSRISSILKLVIS